MKDNFEKLLTECKQRLKDDGYSYKYISSIIYEWEHLKKWMENHKITEFNEAVAYKYCDETFGNHIIYKGISASYRKRLRAIRMLTSFWKTGSFEYYTPKTEKEFKGIIAEDIEKYMNHCIVEKYFSDSTVHNYKYYLFRFNKFIDTLNINLDELSIDKIEDFLNEFESLSSKHNAAGVIRRFLKYEYENGKTIKDNSVFCLRDNYKGDCKLPTTYTEDEIKAVLDAVDRSSIIGKRDYIVLLLSAEYGMRARDIVDLTFDNIDWDKNIITFIQHKTGNRSEYPLLANVGNAIIDYLKNGRPDCDTPQIIVSHGNKKLGQTLSPISTHKIVTKYMKLAEIKDWENKKHGTHAFRHSLASNMQSKNVSLHVISSTIGHQSTETTKTYISIDYDSLKKCALPMPSLHSPFYLKEDDDHDR